MDFRRWERRPPWSAYGPGASNSPPSPTGNWARIIWPCSGSSRSISTALGVIAATVQPWSEFDGVKSLIFHDYHLDTELRGC